MPIYNFQKRFADAVESGAKCQTIRKRRKRPTQAGETLHLYTGLRSKNPRKLRPDNPECTNVLPLEIHDDSVYTRGRVKVGPDWVPENELDNFARADGFFDALDFFAFWREVHGLVHGKPLTGFELIQWEPKE